MTHDQVPTLREKETSRDQQAEDGFLTEHGQKSVLQMAERPAGCVSGTVLLRAVVVVGSG